MTKSEIKKLANVILQKVINHYGLSNHHNETPYLCIDDSPYSDADDADCIGEYCSMYNELILYWKNIKSYEILVKTVVHEYQHYLQSPIWMKRYYNMGYHYSNHPYEIAAYNEESNWKLFK